MVPPPAFPDHPTTTPLRHFADPSLPAGRVFGRLGDALPELSKRLPAVAGLHSGPSKSADIGRTIVTGVHGPGRCIAVLIPGPGPEDT